MDYIRNIVKQVLKEEHSSRYMFFQNIEQMKRQCEILLEMNQDEITAILEDGHDWAKSRYKVCPSAYCNGAAVKRYNSQGGKWVKK